MIEESRTNEIIGSAYDPLHYLEQLDEEFGPFDEIYAYEMIGKYPKPLGKAYNNQQYLHVFGSTYRIEERIEEYQEGVVYRNGRPYHANKFWQNAMENFGLEFVECKYHLMPGVHSLKQAAEEWDIPQTKKAIAEGKLAKGF